MSTPKTLKEWLSFIESLHEKTMSLGLERVRRVAEALGVLMPSCPVVTVAGTNGKGSTIAVLEAIYTQAGFNVGVFSTPYVVRFNEQLRLNGEPLSDELLCQYFARINDARGEEALTIFEFKTLAALLLMQGFGLNASLDKLNARKARVDPAVTSRDDNFHLSTAHALDVMLLEVGLGGRLDAVNIVDPTIAVLTSIGLDHCHYLGETREAIATEKMGITRDKGLFVCGDPHPPETVFKIAREKNLKAFYSQKDFYFEEYDEDWAWHFLSNKMRSLPKPTSLLLSNATTALMVATLLQDTLPVKKKHIKQALKQVRLLGRLQVIHGNVTTLVDVAHNAESVAELSRRLTMFHPHRKTIAIFSALRDKDVATMIAAVKHHFDAWYVAPIDDPRATCLQDIEAALLAAGVKETVSFKSIEEAYFTASNNVSSGDMIVAFGSFHVAGEVLQYFESGSRGHAAG